MARLRVLGLFAVFALTVVPLLAQRPTGVGKLAGLILIDDGGQSPVRGAIVTISAPELGRPRSMITDVAGAFSFANLPAGRFTLTATKVPFLSMTYGAARPGRQGTSIRLVANESLENIVLRLPRGGVITGMLRDQLGAPVEGVTVSATRPNATVQASSTPLLPSATTDDRGVYRIFGLMPGEYFVAATFSSLSAGPLTEVSRAEMDRRLAELGRGRGPGLGGAVALPAARPSEPPRDPGFTLAPTFYPGTTDPAAATLVTVASGEERNADFVLGPVRAGVIEGVIRTADGSAVPSVPAGSSLPSALIVALDPIGPQLPFGLGNAPTLQLRPSAADGRFRFTGVAPGKYALSAATMTRSSGNIFATVDVTATGDDITGLTLTLDRGPRLSGSVRFVGTLAPPTDVTKIRVTIASNRPIPGLGLGFSRPQDALASPAADGSIEFRNLQPASYTVEPMAVGGWVLQSAMIDGRDALEVPFEISPGVDVSGAVLTFSDTHTELSGTLRTASNAPATEFFVVAFPTDQARWTATRRKQSARPASDGVFTLKDLPAGEYYLAALTDVTADDLKDASFLAQMVATAIRVTIVDGEKKTQDLKIGR